MGRPKKKQPPATPSNPQPQTPSKYNPQTASNLDIALHAKHAHKPASESANAIIAIYLDNPSATPRTIAILDHETRHEYKSHEYVLTGRKTPKAPVINNSPLPEWVEKVMNTKPQTDGRAATQTATPDNTNESKVARLEEMQEREKRIKGNIRDTATRTARNNPTFEQLKTLFEQDVTSNNEQLPNMLPLAIACVRSVLKKVLDPRRNSESAWNAMESTSTPYGWRASNKPIGNANGNSKSLLDVERDTVIYQTVVNAMTTLHDLDRPLEIDYATNTATHDNAEYDKMLDGIVERLSEISGCDLVQVACVALLETARDNHINHNSPNWLETDVGIREIDSRVVIKDGHSAKWNVNRIKPIQYVFRQIRRAIVDERPTRIKESTFTYMESFATDPETGNLDRVFYQFGRYAELGGNEHCADSGYLNYLENAIAKMNLTKRETTVLYLAHRHACGNKAIASYLGITPQAVAKIRKRIASKAEQLNMHVVAEYPESGVVTVEKDGNVFEIEYNPDESNVSHASERPVYISPKCPPKPIAETPVEYLEIVLNMYRNNK